MKKAIFISLVIMCLGSMVMAAQITALSIDWAYDGNAVGWTASKGTYNKATGNFLICDFAASAVRIASGADGTLTGATLDTSGLNFGSSTLGIFGICCTDDGVIYGGLADSKTDGSPGNSLVRWENESAVPTQQDPAPLGTTELTFARTLDVKGTGTDTMIAVLGLNYDCAQILTTTDGTTFAITDKTLGPDFTTGLGKSGVALKTGGTTAYGSQADGSNWIRRHDKIGDTWANNETFNSGVVATNLPTAIGYADVANIIFALETHGGTEATPDNLIAIDGDTGAELLAADIGVLVARYAYGKCDIDETVNKVYFAARGSDGSAAKGYMCGVASYSTPTPTPTPLAAFSVWGLYE